jgi:hypothetical protein
VFILWLGLEDLRFMIASLGFRVGEQDDKWRVKG